MDSAEGQEAGGGGDGDDAGEDPGGAEAAVIGDTSPDQQANRGANRGERTFEREQGGTLARADLFVEPGLHERHHGAEADVEAEEGDDHEAPMVTGEASSDKQGSQDDG